MAILDAIVEQLLLRFLLWLFLPLLQIYVYIGIVERHGTAHDPVVIPMLATTQCDDSFVSANRLCFYKSITRDWSSTQIPSDFKANLSLLL